MLVIVFSAGKLYAQIPISAVIPDICSPGMNIALEILAPAANKGAFGRDGIFLNNANDTIKVRTLNPKDSNTIIFSPFIVSWEGRVISIQAFVPPLIAGGPSPNSWDWSLVQTPFRIPICITMNGLQSIIDTLYIVQPFPFGNRVSDSQTSVFGAGTWGKRSRRGAMIVDSMILPLNGKFEVSTNDCDPLRPGNQGYLPFTLIVKGNVQGSGGIISVNANRQNGGPGGGGGAGVFCDISSPQSTAGNGYSGGAPGGRNGSGIPLLNNVYTIPGIGTGNNGSGSISGSTITGVRGGECRAFEGGGGGTGHPYGMSGSGSYGKNGGIDGFYGGGSSPTDELLGGGGGYRTDGAHSNGINGGKVHGNRAVVPLAGGSGGGTGNPRAGFGSITCSGYGGGGGGALSIHGNSIANIILEAKGESGENNNPNGGGGSGGFIGIGARYQISAMSHSVTGGPGQTSGGEGRFKFESPIYPNANPNSYPIVNVAGQESYRGLTLEYASIIDRSKPLSMVYSCGDSIQFYLKAHNGDWTPYTFGPAANGVPLLMPFNDINLLPDSLYYIMGIQSNKTFSTLNEYQHEPIGIISQSAANVLYAPVYPIISSDTNIRMQQALICTNDTAIQGIKVYNKGNGVLRIDSLRWVNGTQGFKIIQPNNFPLTIKSGDSSVFTVSFKRTSGVGSFTDFLTIYSNAQNDSTWNIAITGKKEQIEFAYRSLNAKTYSRSFTINGACIGFPKRDTIVIVNKSSISIPSDSIRLSGSNDISIIPLRQSISALDSAFFIIQFIPNNTNLQTVNLEVHHPLCDTIDIVSIQGIGIAADIIANVNSISNPNQPLGLVTTQTFVLFNKGTAATTIMPTTFGISKPFTISSTKPILPYQLQAGDSIIFTLSIEMKTPGNVRDTIEIIGLAQLNGCPDTVQIPLSATSSLPNLAVRFANNPIANPKDDSYAIPIFYKISGGDTIIPDMKISFAVNGSLFYPLSSSKGSMSSMLDANGKRIINVTFDKTPIVSTDSILTIINGIIQLDTITSSPLEWYPLRWNTAVPYATTIFINGNILLDICEIGGQRLILNGTTPFMLKAFPNPISSGQSVQVQFPIHRLGKYGISIIDMTGKLLQTHTLVFNDVQQLGKQYQLSINAHDLASGSYLLSVSLDGIQLTERLMIIP